MMDINDFTAGQMVGMLVLLTFIERNNGIPDVVVQKVKETAADNVQEYFQKPSEDIFLMIDQLVNEIEKL